MHIVVAIIEIVLRIVQIAIGLVPVIAIVAVVLIRRMLRVPHTERSADTPDLSRLAGDAIEALIERRAPEAVIEALVRSRSGVPTTAASAIAPSVTAGTFHADRPSPAPPAILPPLGIGLAARGRRRSPSMMAIARARHGLCSSR